MEWLSQVKKFLRRNPAAIALGILALLLLIAERIHKLTYVAEVLDPVIQWGVETTGAQAVHIKLWFALCEFLLIGLALFGLALWARSKMDPEVPAKTKEQQEEERRKQKEAEERERKEEAEKREREERIAHIEHALQLTMAAASRIKNQLMPTKSKPKRQLVSMENTYVIRKNFDTEVTRRFQMKASHSAIHFWECIIQVSDAECNPVKYLDTINFEAVDDNAHGGTTDIVYLPLRNDPFSKEVLVYFLPQIDPAETSARAVSVTYCWPGMCKELKINRRDEWGWNVESEEAVPDVVFRFLTEDLGGKLEMKITGSRDGTQSIVDSGKNSAGLNQIEYRIKNAPSGHYRVELLLK
jgi:hypothetical protein